MGAEGGGRAVRGAPLLLLCWLCCWPDDRSSDTSSGKYSRKSTIDNEGARHASVVLVQRRPHASAISLHLPGTSGMKQSLSSHRSHEEIRSRRKSHLSPESDSTRYFSAPSMIDQVVHRRDWNRSTKELHIPLKPTKEDLLKSNNPNDIYIPLKSKYDIDSEDESPKAPLAINESLSGDLQEKQCKKHHTNIKSSKRDKESNSEDIKDVDATEHISIYIGEVRDDTLTGLNRTDSGSTLVNKLSSDEDENFDLETIKVCRLKDEKQCLNDLIKSLERSTENSVSECEYQPMSCEQSMAQIVRDLVEPDRSGAMHRTESRISLATSIARSLPCAPSVEPVSYSALPCIAARSRLSAALCEAAPRPRHASDGDILAPACRPDSGAFSGIEYGPIHLKSDLELELDLDEPPPPYCELPPRSPPAHPAPRTTSTHRETAI